MVRIVPIKQNVISFNMALPFDAPLLPID